MFNRPLGSGNTVSIADFQSSFKLPSTVKRNVIAAVMHQLNLTVESVRVCQSIDEEFLLSSGSLTTFSRDKEIVLASTYAKRALGVLNMMSLKSMMTSEPVEIIIAEGPRSYLDFNRFDSVEEVEKVWAGYKRHYRETDCMDPNRAVWERGQKRTELRRAYPEALITDGFFRLTLTIGDGKIITKAESIGMQGIETRLEVRKEKVSN